MKNKMWNGRIGQDSVLNMIVPLLIVCLGPAAVYAQDIATGPESIIPPNTHVELLFDGADGFTEGPAVDPNGMVYFSDITRSWLTDMKAGHIMKYDPVSGETSVFRSPSGMANGISFDLEGRMIVAEGADFGGRRITRTDLATGKSVILAGLFEERAFNAPNDLVIDEAGRIYFTDPRYFGHESMEQPYMGVYRIDPDGEVSRIINSVGFPNGILISPDQSTLYVASLQAPLWYQLNALLAFDLLDDGTVSNRRILKDFSPGAGPDGMAIDTNGNLYLGRPGQPRGIHIYSPEGDSLGFIPTPANATNAAFGRGDNSNVLYITAGKGLYQIRLKTDGYHAANWE